MTEQLINKVEKTDIQAPEIQPGGTAIVLQRHEDYVRDRDASNAGSLKPGVVDAARQRDIEFFDDMLKQEADGAELRVLFVASPTEFAGKGHRSVQTADIAMKAAIEAMEKAGIDPATRIINIADQPKKHEKSGTNVRPMAHLEEPRMFDQSPDYVSFLKQKYGVNENDPGRGPSQAAFAAHEMDAEAEVRKSFGAEGVYDTLDRTKHAISVFERYSEKAHSKMPNTRLVIWAASHYDTISPLVKDAMGTSFEEYLPVDFAGGVVMNIQPGSREVKLDLRQQEIALNLGKTAVEM